LVPAEPAKTFFIATIASLAAKFDAVVFEPHLTIHVTNSSLEEPAIVLRRTVATSPYRLKVRNIDSSDAFTKTLFLQFEADTRLAQLSEKLRRASGSGDDYQLNPHLSLIYKKMEGDEKRKIAQSIQLPFVDVLFDSAKAVISPAEIQSRADVEAWRVVAEHSLAR
jgi:hypothetical protein